jgi:hypothetical protein
MARSIAAQVDPLFWSAEHCVQLRAASILAAPLVSCNALLDSVVFVAGRFVVSLVYVRSRKSVVNGPVAGWLMALPAGGTPEPPGR